MMKMRALLKNVEFRTGANRATIGPTMPVMWSAQKATGGKGNLVKEHARIDAGKSSNAGPAATPAAIGNAIGCQSVTGKETDA